MICTLTETIRPFAEAARRLPSLRGGRPVSPCTIWRWCTSGVRARDGRRIRLEFIKLGSAACTSDEALARFFAALTPSEETAQAAPKPMSKVQEMTKKDLDLARI